MSLFDIVPRLPAIAAVIFAGMYTYISLKLLLETRRWSKFGITGNIRRHRNQPHVTFWSVYKTNVPIVLLGLIYALVSTIPQPYQGLFVVSGVFFLLTKFFWTTHYFNRR